MPSRSSTRVPCIIDPAVAKEGTRSFVLRIDAQTLEAVERWAADEFRSTNGQLQWIIEEALMRAGRKKKKE